jgi:hypothetical protein
MPQPKGTKNSGQLQRFNESFDHFADRVAEALFFGFVQSTIWKYHWICVLNAQAWTDTVAHNLFRNFVPFQILQPVPARLQFI